MSTVFERKNLVFSRKKAAKAAASEKEKSPRKSGGQRGQTDGENKYKTAGLFLINTSRRRSLP
jgi:hypothetical protein